MKHSSRVFLTIVGMLMATMLAFMMYTCGEAGRTGVELTLEEPIEAPLPEAPECEVDDDCEEPCSVCDDGVCVIIDCAEQGLYCDEDSNRCVECLEDIHCEDESICTTDECIDHACVHTPVEDCCEVDADCDDGDFCTTDTCNVQTGECTNTPVPDCCNYDRQCEDDGNVCTDEICSDHSCISVFNTAPCDDGNPCTYPDTCSQGECIPGPLDDECCTDDGKCDDYNVCTDDHCDLTTNLCVNAFNTADCDDGDICTENDKCAEGQCIGTRIFPPDCCYEHSDCIDGDECTTDICEANVCVNDDILGCCNDDIECNDGKVCTTDSCVDHVCVNDAIPNCCTVETVEEDCQDDPDPCIKAVCIMGAEYGTCALEAVYECNADVTDGCCPVGCSGDPGDPPGSNEYWDLDCPPYCGDRLKGGKVGVGEQDCGPFNGEYKECCWADSACNENNGHCYILPYGICEGLNTGSNPCWGDDAHSCSSTQEGDGTVGVCEPK